MTYTVTYRDKSGAKREEVLEAAGRAECLAECKRRGIVPISIREGANGRAGRSRPAVVGGKGDGASGGRALPNGKPQASILNLKSAIFLAAVLAVAGGAWWWLSAREAQRPPVEKPKAAKDVKVVKDVKDLNVPKDIPAAAPKPVPAEVPTSGETSVEPTAEEPPRKLTMAERGIRVVKPRKPLRPRRFKYNAEEHIAFFLETEPGAAVFGEIPYGPKFVEDFKASLNEPVAILPDDSEEDRQLKRAVQETKEELKAQMEAGEDIAKIMKDSRRQLIELGRYKSALEDDLKKIARGGEFDEEEFTKFVNAANKMLEDKGLSPIKPTRMMYKMLELKARRSNRK